jgi:hypothetical protein
LWVIKIVKSEVNQPLVPKILFKNGRIRVFCGWLILYCFDRV